MSLSNLQDGEDLSTSLQNLNLNEEETLRRSTRSRTITEKAKENAVAELIQRKGKLCNRIKRKRKTIEDLLYSSENATTIKEELNQLNDIFSILEDVSNSVVKLDTSDDWFDREEEDICELKHKIHNWLKEAFNKGQSEVRSRHSGKSRSSVSYRSSRSSRSALEDKKKLRELEASTSFAEKKAEMKLISAKLEFEEQLAIIRARVMVDDEEEHKDTKLPDQASTTQENQILKTCASETSLVTTETTSQVVKPKEQTYTSDALITNMFPGNYESEITKAPVPTWDMTESQLNKLFRPDTQRDILDLKQNKNKCTVYDEIDTTGKDYQIRDDIKKKTTIFESQQKVQLPRLNDDFSGNVMRENTFNKFSRPPKLSTSNCYDEKAKPKNAYIASEDDNKTWGYHSQIQETFIPQAKACEDRHYGEKDSKIMVSSTNQLCSLLKLQSEPDVEIDTFRGDPIEFQFFISMFTVMVENRIDDQMGRLTRLLKYTEGEPKDLIKPCLYQPKDICYKTAKELLERQYGNPQRILSAYRDALINLSPIKPNDSSSLRRLFNFLLKVNGIKLGLNHNPLDNFDTICRVLSRLPMYMQNRWGRNVHKMRKQENRDPRLQDLILLIEDEMTMNEDPLFSRPAINKYKDKGERLDKSSTGRRQVKDFAIEVNQKSNLNLTKCQICKREAHAVEKCKEYLELSIEDRSKRIFKCRLCFKCLKPVSQNHTASSCKTPLKCIACNQPHPTSLHGLERGSRQNGNSFQKKENEKEKENTDKPMLNALARSQNHSDTISLCVVPIQITHDSCSNIISTYAMLDSCSQGSFVTEKLAKTLSIEGRSTSLSIKTVNGEREHKTRAIDNLKVRKYDNCQWLTISKSFTEAEIPVDKKDVASVDQIKGWTHLAGILEELRVKGDINVEVLIGANCPKALEPLKFIHSENGGPYAVKTRLGWCIVGPTCNSIVSNGESEAISSNWAAYEEVIQPSFPASVKECDTKNMILAMYGHDFIENTSIKQQQESLSVEDERFLQIVEEGTIIVDGHYQVPLPFKENNIKLPNNRKQAYRRFMNLQKKFEKDEEFKQLYFKSMSEMFEKGHAEEACDNPVGSSWYIPHHGVKHPANPGKIRVVFDASAEYEGQSINNNLLKGPDLISQLMGVLIRFREEPIAITADIEGMFYQVKLPPHQRSVFKFLWYEDNDSEKEIKEFQMTSHIFGGTSSPSCSNFALRKTAKDNQHQFSDVTTSALLRNIYVDDLLKALILESEAKSFVKEVKDLCSKGGFNLTKFASNNSNVLGDLSIEHKKTDSIENNILNDIPEQSTLGMKWNLADVTLRFKLNKDAKPTTKRGISSTISSIYDPLGIIGPYVLPGKVILQKLCKANISWDDNIPSALADEWSNWRKNLTNIENIKIDRCLKTTDFNDPIEVSLHIFSDASDIGYGVACYLRYVNKQDDVHCSLLYGRSRVNPVRYVSIPRMELSAALLAAKTNQLLKK